MTAPVLTPALYWKLQRLQQQAKAAPSGAVGTDTIWNAKGDLAVATAADTAAPLPIGSSGQVLTVASGTAAWATPGGGTLPDPVTIAHGGTGGTTAGGARTALGVAIGSDVEAWSARLDTLSATSDTGTGAVVRANSPALVTPTGIVKGDVGLGSVDNTADASKPVSTAQAAADALALAKASNLADLANAGTARTNLGVAVGTNVEAWSARLDTLAGTTDTGTGAVVRASSPALVTPTGIVKADVGLGNVDNTSNATERAAVATLTNKTLTSPAITTPTGIVKGDVGLGNVDNTSNATERAATATLANKTLTSPVVNTPTGIVAGDIASGTFTVPRGGTGLATLTAHAVLLGEGTSTVADTGAGTALQVLQSNGASADPTWVTVTDGWITAVNTWTFASATSFTVNGVDATGWLYPGTKVSWNDATNVPGYGVISASTFSTNTTVTVITTSDFVMANHAFTAPRFSHEDSPAGFPRGFNWAPTSSGWTTTPGGVYRWHTKHRACYLSIAMAAATSNSVTHTFTLPVTAATTTSANWITPAYAVDATTKQIGYLQVLSAGTTVVCVGILATNSNTNTLSSQIIGEVWYEF